MRRLLVIVAAAVALTGCVGDTDTAREAPSSTAPTLRELPHSATTAPAPTPVHARVPTRLRLWHYDAQVVPISPIGTVLTPPPDPQTLGWWGRRAGARSGATLLTGHTVHTGGGEFDDLEDVPLGARADLSGVAYRVVRVEVITKDALAARAPRLLAQDGRPRLVLVTCEGYDPATGHYDDNVVVILNRV